MNKKALYLLKKNPKKLINKSFLVLLRKPIIRSIISDKLYVKYSYRVSTNEKLNLDEPITYNEKIQWLKLYDKNPQYVNLADKYLVRDYISNLIGGEYLVPLIGIYNNVDEIKWSDLPNKFVLKCNHGSGTNIICKNKDELDIKDAIKKLKYWMKTNYYWYSREWPYKNIKRKIICEKYLEEPTGESVKDYRFFCFNGVPHFIAVDFNITDKTKTRRNLYNMNWELMDVGVSYPQQREVIVEKPYSFDKMIEICRILSKGIPHVRVDFFSLGRKFYIGELTLYHQSGHGKFSSDQFAKYVGRLIQLPKRDKESL